MIEQTRVAIRHASALLTLIRRLHFYIGLFIGPFIFTASLTGTLYVLAPQIEETLYAQQLFTSSSGDEQLLARQVEAALAVAGPEAQPVALRPAPGPRDTTRVMFHDSQLGPSEYRALFIDPRTLEVRGDLTVYGTSGVLPLRMWLDKLHRALLLGDIGRNYSELAASWMWIVGLGGMILWLKNGNQKRTRKIPTAGRTRSYLKNKRWHTSLGLALVTGLILFSATGLSWSQWAGNNIGLLRNTMGWMTPQLNASLTPGCHDAAPVTHQEHMSHSMSVMVPAIKPVDFDMANFVARNAGIIARQTEIRPPLAAGQAWTVSEIKRSWPTRVDAVAVDTQRQIAINKVSFSDYPLMAKLTRWGIDAHMGVLFGLPNQIILALFGLGLCTLIACGYRMWWLRRPQAPARNPLRTIRESWLGLPRLPRFMLFIVVLASGIGIPLMGISLLLFMVIDTVRWHHAQQKSL